MSRLEDLRIAIKSIHRLAELIEADIKKEAGMSHWPDLERCKRLRDAGFGQNTEYFWVIYKESTWVEHRHEKAAYEFVTVAAPIVTELIEELVGKSGRYITITRHDNRDEPTHRRWFIEYSGLMGEYETFADTLPNALADLWLREKGEKG